MLALRLPLTVSSATSTTLHHVISSSYRLCIHCASRREYFKLMQPRQVSIYGKIQQNATHYKQALKFYLLIRMLHLWLHKSNIAVGYGKYSMLLQCKLAYLKDLGVSEPHHATLLNKEESCGQSCASHKTPGWMKCKTCT